MKVKIKNQKVRSILVSILIGVVAFPTITLSGTFVSSLIQGKTVEEAVQILAEQIDFLIGRVEIIEIKQTEIETEQLKVKTKQVEQEQTILELQATADQQQKEIVQQEAYNQFRKVYDKVWLYGKTEENTIRNTREYCQQAIQEGNEAKQNNFCPLANELESAWNIYQNSLK